ncbi:MAG: hypothetical protein AVDCRST_MAG30-4320 [uncultured Solirubrobacteraceae bacterium]|uniref:PsbP C-terminal domain-containing protein n=1 Tax=uncultured Solirubrobacteraceae bacterium TaxID=1162706 RepID=A0A6J4TZV0_9ACTN|nr:MAG: hypothetical protein AVDCRST_MAG30-4320 [uncultured Solirubrobacteraceae bacterium]
MRPRATRTGSLLLVLGAGIGGGGCNTGQERAGAQGSVGYTVTAPQGWADITREVERDAGVAFDVAYGGPVDGGGRATVNITQRDAGDGASLARLIRAGRAEVDELAGGDLELSPVAAAAIDGAPAQRYEFSANGKRVRQVGTLYEGEFYVVTLTAPAAGFRGALARLDGVLRSWRWD